MTCERVRRVVSAYRDGLLAEPDRRAVGEHLRGCPACAAEYDAFDAMVRDLGSLPSMEPPADFLDGVRTRISALPAWTVLLRRFREPGPARAAAGWALAAAAVALVVLSGTPRGFREAAAPPSGKTSIALADREAQPTRPAPAESPAAVRKGRPPAKDTVVPGPAGPPAEPAAFGGGGRIAERPAPALPAAAAAPTAGGDGRAVMSEVSAVRADAVEENREKGVPAPVLRSATAAKPSVPVVLVLMPARSLDRTTGLLHEAARKESVAADAVAGRERAPILGDKWLLLEGKKAAADDLDVVRRIVVSNDGKVVRTGPSDGGTEILADVPVDNAGRLVEGLQRVGTIEQRNAFPANGRGANVQVQILVQGRPPAPTPPGGEKAASETEAVRTGRGGVPAAP